MSDAGYKTLRDLTPKEREDWETWLESHWGAMPFSAFRDVPPLHLPVVSPSTLRNLVKKLEERRGEPWMGPRRESPESEDQGPDGLTPADRESVEYVRRYAQSMATGRARARKDPEAGDAPEEREQGADESQIDAVVTEPGQMLRRRSVLSSTDEDPLSSGWWFDLTSESEPIRRSVPVSQIVTDSFYQVRELDEATVRHYVALLEQSAPPPVDLAILTGPYMDGRLFLANGWHRHAAAVRAGRGFLDAVIHPVSSRKEILLLAVKANAYNGLPLTLKARKRAARRLLELFPERSNRWIGEDLGISHHTVRRIREEMEAGGQIAHLTILIGSDGKPYAQEFQPGWGPSSTADDGISTAQEADRAKEDPPAPRWLLEFEEPSEELEQPPTEEKETSPADAASGSGASDEADISPSATTEEEESSAALLVPTPRARTRPVPVEVYQGDARDLVWTLPEPVHLTVTSPPYNVGTEYDGHDDNLPMSDYLDLLSGVFRAVRAKTVDGGRIAVVVPFGVHRSPWQPLMPLVMNQLVGTGWTMRGLITWDKGSTGSRTSWGSFRSPTDPALRDRTECILVAHAGSSRLEVPSGVLERDEKGVYSPLLQDGDAFMELAEDYWRVRPESSAKIGHPAPFPVEIPWRLISLYAFPGARILDPFAGSGTTGVAALRAGCPAYLIEKSPSYCELARRRVKVG